MAKKNDGYLNRKERKKFSKLISNKLLGLGVKDEIIMQNTRILKSFVDENGKEIFKGQMRIAQNVHRNLVKKLRNLPRVAVMKFLASDIEVPKK